MRIFTIIFLCFISILCSAQPAPCEPTNPEMTSFCIEACVICDIDGFTGRHQATIVGEAPPGFAGECTITAHNMQWIAFIAGSENLKVRMSVSNCENDLGLEFGLYKGVDCQNFKRISNCFGGFSAIGPGESGVISNNEPLEVGQYYFIVMDGGLGDNCDWTFTVEEGSTTAEPLTFTRDIEGPGVFCPDVESSFISEAELGATLFLWTLNGAAIGDPNSNTLDLNLSTAGEYTLCVTAANACDEASPTCKQIEVIDHPETYIADEFCSGDCYEIDGNTYCDTGNFSYSIPLANGCDSIIILDLVELDQPVNLVDVNICEGDTIFIDGSPYTEAGIYQQIVLTDNNCDSIVDLDLFVVVCDIEATFNISNPKCYNGADGKISFEVLNGTPPFTYSWSDLNGNTSGTGLISNINLEIQIPDLGAGQYIIEIEDGFDNTEILIVELLDPDEILIRVTESDYNGFGVSCHDSANGFLFAGAEGGSMPYQFTWSNNFAGENNANLPADIYTLILRDSDGCEVSSVHEITAPEPITATLELVNPDCDGLETGSILVNSVNGGVGPFQFQINNSDFQDQSNFDALGPGNYNIQILDENACSEELAAALIAPEIPILSLPKDTTVPLGDSFAITAILNTINVESITWSTTEFLSCYNCLESYAYPLHSAEYQLEVVSQDGCLTRESMYIEVEKTYAFYAPNIFSPNNDGRNDEFKIFRGLEVKNLQLYVFDRWGNLVYEDENSEEAWDGKIHGKALHSGVYTWFAEIEFIDGVLKTYSGNVSLIR